MASTGGFGELPMDCGYWAPVQTATPFFFAPPLYVAFYVPTTPQVMEAPRPMAPFGYDGVPSAAHLPPSVPWTPAPTVPPDERNQGAAYGYAAQPVPLWIKTGFFYAQTPQYMYVPHLAMEPVIPAQSMAAYGNPAWQPTFPVRRRGAHSRRGPPGPSGARRTRDPPAGRPGPPPAAAAAAPEVPPPVGTVEDCETSPDVPEEPDADLAGQPLAKKKAAEATPAPGTTQPSGSAVPASTGQKLHRVYSAATLKSLNTRGPVHPSLADGISSASEPRIEYDWPEIDPKPPKVPVRRPKARVAQPGGLPPPRAKSSMQEGRRAGTQRERGPRRRSSVTAW